MASKRPVLPPVHRTDLLPSNLTAGKRAKVLDLLTRYRAGAVLLEGREMKVSRHPQGARRASR